MSDNKARQRVIMKCYASALQELKKHHEDEFKMILQEKYDDAGLTVRSRTRKAGSVKTDRIDAHKADMATAG